MSPFTTPTSTMTVRILYAAMQVEFLVIHSCAFLGFLAVLRPMTTRGKIGQQVCFWGLLAVYVGLAVETGPEATVMFITLLVATYLPLFFNLRKPEVLVELGGRWLVFTITAVIVWTANDMPTTVDYWDDTVRSLHSGMWYFLCLAGYEAIGIFRSRAIRLIAAQESSGGG